MLTQQTVELKEDEGWRAMAYDDATGKPVVPGYTMVGHVSVGWGRCLDDCNGITQDEGYVLLTNDLTTIERQLGALPWFRAIDEVRQGVVTNMAYNMGVGGVRRYVRMIAHIEAEEWAAAAREMDDWQCQASRRERCQRQMLTGTAWADEAVA